LLLKEFTQIAIGLDPIGQLQTHISNSGTVVVLEGEFGAGSAEEVAKLLEASPHVRTLLVRSAGGRLREVWQLARNVRIRRLNTMVDSICESACTFVFMAGVDRVVTEDARIGFHRPSFSGLNSWLMAQKVQQMSQWYREAGASEDFIQHVADTESTKMWYPTTEELLLNKVATRVIPDDKDAENVLWHDYECRFCSLEKSTMSYERHTTLELVSRLIGCVEQSGCIAIRSLRFLLRRCRIRRSTSFRSRVSSSIAGFEKKSIEAQPL